MMKTLNFFGKIFSVTATAAMALAIASTAAKAGIYESLTPAEQATIQRGEQVVKTEDVAGSVWPKITVLQRLDSPADEVAAVMFDYPGHVGMFEGVIKSAPKTPGAAVTEIDYIMTFPKVMGVTLPDEEYTVLDKLSSYAPGSYEISWTMVRASSMKDTSGSVKFEPLGTSMLISYTNFINPPRPALAKLIVKMAFQRVKDSVTALAKKVQVERASDRAKLDAQLAALKKALGQ